MLSEQLSELNLEPFDYKTVTPLTELTRENTCLIPDVQNECMQNRIEHVFHHRGYAQYRTSHFVVTITSCWSHK